MSTAHLTASWDRAGASTTVRQFRRAVVLAFGIVAFGGVIYLVETFVLRSEHRLVENPTDLMMRAFGLSHFIIGWLFLFSSPRLRSGPALLRLAGWTAAGVGFCFVFGAVGGRSNLFALMGFYSFFLFHEVRDEAHLYQTYGDAPDATRWLIALRWAVFLGMTSLISTAFLLKANLTGKRILSDTPWFTVQVSLGILYVATGCAMFYALYTGRQTYGRLRTAIAVHAPLMSVYAGIFLILSVGSLLGSSGLNLIILIHAATWLVFVNYQLKKRPKESAKNLWTWLRSTPLGFLTLHFGVLALVLVLMALRVYLWQKVGTVSVALASSSYPYWGIMHITMAFWRK